MQDIEKIQIADKEPGKTVLEDYGDIAQNGYAPTWDYIDFYNITVIFKNKIVPESTSKWFANTYTTEFKNIENWDTSKVTNMTGMFDSCIITPPSWYN